MGCKQNRHLTYREKERERLEKKLAINVALDKERKGNLHAVNSPLAFELWVLLDCSIVDFMHMDFYGLQITN